MQQFQYKILWSTHKVGISREMISYKNKNIQASQITGFGIQLVPVTRYAMGPGAASWALTRKKYLPYKEINKKVDLENLPDKNAQLIIAYTEPGQEKKKSLYIPTFTDNKDCVQMLKTMKKTFPNKFVGVGIPPQVTKALGISLKATWVAIAIIILVATGIVAAIFYKEIQ